MWLLLGALCHSLFMFLLFAVEFSSFMTTTTHSNVVVDFNTDQQVCASPASYL